jgi:signal peptide peptidase SppA
MVCPAEAEMILSALGGKLPAGVFFGDFAPERSRTYEIKNGVAIIPVMGGLIYRGYGWYWRSTYGQIRAQFREALADAEVSAILFDVDSPGGEVAGVFDLVDEIHAARGQKQIWAAANEDCFSAAYAIASAADKVFVPRTGAVGSVGVIAIHYEQAKAEEEAGIRYTAIFAGAHKNDFTMHAPLSAAARQVAQASVDKTYDLFVATVACNRNLSDKSVRDQQAGIYEGEDAVAAGMADGVMTFDEVLAELGHHNTSKGGTGMEFAQIFTGLAALLGDAEQRQAATEKLNKMGLGPIADPAATTASLAEAEQRGRVAGVAEERARGRAIAENCVLAGTAQLAPALIGDGATIEAAGTRIQEAKHNADPSREMDNSNSGLGSNGADYLLADAKRRAAKS